MGAPGRRGGDRAKPPEIRGLSPACGARGAGRRGRASPARRPGPMEKVYRYGRVLAAAGRGVDSRGGRGRKISQRAGQDGAGGLPPRAGPDRWKKYAGTAGFWPPRGGRAGAGAQNRSARRAGRRWRASPARRPGPVGKVYRYGRVLAAGRGRAAAGGGGAKSVSARGAGGGHGAAAASLHRLGNRRGTGRRRAGRRRKIGQRAKRGGRTAGKSRAQDGGQGVVGRRRARL